MGRFCEKLSFIFFAFCIVLKGFAVELFDRCFVVKVCNMNCTYMRDVKANVDFCNNLKLLRREMERGTREKKEIERNLLKKMY